MFEMIGNTAREAVVGGPMPIFIFYHVSRIKKVPIILSNFRAMIHTLIKQIPKRPRLRPVCEFTTANHRDGATNNRIPNSIANHANGKMQYNPGWESGSMKTLAAHGLAGGIVQDRMGGSFGAGFLSGSLGSYLGSLSRICQCPSLFFTMSPGLRKCQ
jgi:hypothetical protein